MPSPRVTFSTKEITNLIERNSPRVDILNPGETVNFFLGYYLENTYKKLAI
jgi:hypothetical protein